MGVRLSPAGFLRNTMAKYIITDNSVVSSGNKTRMEVTFIDEVNGKDSVTCLHEVESSDEAVIAEQLSLAALEFEAREAASPVSPVLVTGQEVVAEAPVESPVAPLV